MPNGNKQVCFKSCTGNHILITISMFTCGGNKQTGKSPEEFIGSKPGFSGGHDTTAKAVESGQVEVGVLSYKTYDKMVKNGDIDPEVCKIIWKTPFYADYNWTAHPDLETKFGKGTTEKVKAALLALPKDLLEVFPREAMIEAEDSDFDGIVEVCKELGFLNSGFPEILAFTCHGQGRCPFPTRRR